MEFALFAQFERFYCLPRRTGIHFRSCVERIAASPENTCYQEETLFVMLRFDKFYGFPPRS